MDVNSLSCKLTKSLEKLDLITLELDKVQRDLYYIEVRYQQWAKSLSEFSEELSELRRQLRTKSSNE